MFAVYGATGQWGLARQVIGEPGQFGTGLVMLAGTIVIGKFSIAGPTGPKCGQRLACGNTLYVPIPYLWEFLVFFGS